MKHLLFYLALFSASLECAALALALPLRGGPARAAGGVFRRKIEGKGGTKNVGGGPPAWAPPAAKLMSTTARSTSSAASSSSASCTRSSSTSPADTSSKAASTSSATTATATKRTSAASRTWTSSTVSTASQSATSWTSNPASETTARLATASATATASSTSTSILKTSSSTSETSSLTSETPTSSSETRTIASTTGSTRSVTSTYRVPTSETETTSETPPSTNWETATLESLTATSTSATPTSTPEQAWRPLAQLEPSWTGTRIIRALALDPHTGTVHLGGTFLHGVASFREGGALAYPGGTDGTENDMDDVAALAFDPARKLLYAAGGFLEVRGLPIARLASWDAASELWAPVGAAEPEADRLAAIGLDRASGRLAVGGAMVLPDGTRTEAPAAVWDPDVAAWAPLPGDGGGFPAITGSDLLHYDGTRVMAVLQTPWCEPGGICSTVALYDGVRWQPIFRPDGVPARPSALVSDGVHSYFLGDAAECGSQLCRSLAGWTEWGAGVAFSPFPVHASSVSGLAFTNGTLYVVGAFAFETGAGLAQGVAAFDPLADEGSGWKPVAPEPPCSAPTSIAVSDVGVLYVGCADGSLVRLGR